MRIRLISCLVLGAAFVAMPARAAVTVRGAVPDDNPRAGWLDRYSEARQGPETVDKVSQTFKVGTEGALDLSGISGDVRVTGGGGTEIKIEATKRVRHRDAEEAKRLLTELRVEMSNVNGRVEVRTIYPRRTGNYRDRGISARVDYVVSVPTGASVSAKNISGDILVSNVKGEVRVETISGDVDVSATPNLASAKSVSGDVRAKDISGATSLALGTVSGTIVASGLKVRAIECGSVSGNVHLSAVQAERAEAKSVSGNIEFDAVLTRGGRYEFTSHSGDVRLVLEAGPGFDLDATTFSGSVRSDLPVTLRPTGDRDNRDQRRASSRSIRGTYGDGGAILAIRTFSGSVIITKK